MTEAVPQAAPTIGSVTEAAPAIGLVASPATSWCADRVWGDEQRMAFALTGPAPSTPTPSGRAVDQSGGSGFCDPGLPGQRPGAQDTAGALAEHSLPFGARASPN